MSQQQLAQRVLTQFEENPDSWSRVPDILERSSFPQSKVRCRSVEGIVPPPLTYLTLWHFQYIGLQILEKLVQTKWKVLPEGQRQGESFRVGQGAFVF